MFCEFLSVALSQTLELLESWATAGKCARGAAPEFGTNTMCTNPAPLGGGGIFLFVMVLVESLIMDTSLHKESFQGC